MPHISRKKLTYKVDASLREYLQQYGRALALPIQYRDLKRYKDAVTLYDKSNRDTLWVSLIYPPEDLKHIHGALKEIYAILRANGDLSVMQHLYVDRVDLCLYGNTNPFRVRIVNRINDNFDYFYIKNADASRVYGLELEGLLSPNRVSYVVHEETLIEEHIAGIPGEEFIQSYLQPGRVENETRLAKEFVKFNERCFVRLLGDMHSSNYVVEILPDFDDVHYRIRAIDFDQQSYEPRKSIYMPQYYKKNMPIIEVGIRHMNNTTVRQYQKEERAMIASRIRYSLRQVMDLMAVMSRTPLSKPEYVEQLRRELAQHHKCDAFLRCNTMGAIVRQSLKLLIENN
ncbi:MAG: hypothetical protein H6713_43240 [Myxococcales bacterium]|nr:hypothetical protein [Myxococcales bacterium]MCB9756781.1 hypothetical protein [Myxococcales bacterium]